MHEQDRPSRYVRSSTVHVAIRKSHLIIHIHTFYVCILHTPPDRDTHANRKSPRKRTISGTSAETTSLGGTSTHEATVSLHDLTSYVQELRTYLPKASLIQKGGGGDKEGGRGGRGRDGSVPPAIEDHITGFMDRIITESWDKMSPKVQ